MLGTTLPSLDALAADPGQAASLSPETARTLMVRCAAVLAALGSVASPVTITEQVEVTTSNVNQLLTVADVAARLAIPKSYAYELVRRRVLPAVRVGTRYVRVPAHAITEWVAKGLDPSRSATVGSAHSHEGRRLPKRPRGLRPSEEVRAKLLG
jgi:excisionase family DNA binding protein